MKLSKPTTARLAARSVTLTLPFAAMRHISIWTRDFLEAEEKICWQYEGLHAPFSREAPAVFEHGGKWYMLTSGMTGYVPNKSDSAVSDAPDRPFVSIGDPHADDASHASFNSQISQVFKVPGKRDLYIALADRWVPDYPVDAKLADLVERCTADQRQYFPRELRLAAHHI